MLGDHTRHGTVAYVAITLFGTFLVAGSLTGYQLIVDSSKVIDTHQVAFLQTVAYATLGLLLAGITIAFSGITLVLRRIHEESNGRTLSSLTGLSLALSDNLCVRILVVVSAGYGLLFAAVSSSLVFQVGPGYSNSYGVPVPSIVPVICCGLLGQMPQFVFYITQQIALILIPLNLVLLFGVSWLVGLNAAAVGYSLKHRTQSVSPRWVGGIGAAVGLFTACPTCAGFFFLEALGVSSAASLSLTLASLQGIFVVIGIPILLFALLLNSRQVQATCDLSRAR